MKTFLYKGKEYSSLWQIRNVAPELVFCDTTPASLLELIGITIKETPDPEPDPAETARRELEAKIAQIDSEISQAIQAGFDYAINGETYHFSYDSFDQQNFTDTANACLMLKSGAQGLPETVTWNAYRADGSLARLTLSADDFLALYAGGALAHKAACMEQGGMRKAELAAVETA